MHIATTVFFFLPFLVPLAAAYSFADTTHTFAFGDSYTYNGYDPRITSEPRRQVPITTTGGRNWIQFIASQTAGGENQLYDLARSGATVDRDLVPDDGAPTFFRQVVAWERRFELGRSIVEWQPETTLFAIWFGINDIGLGWALEDSDMRTLIPDILDVYDKQVQKLYAGGARNFLLLSIPPTYRSPAVDSHHNKMNVSDDFKANAEHWNRELGNYAASFPELFPGSSVVLHNTYDFIGKIMDAPREWGFVDNSTFCDDYAGLYNDPSHYLPACKYPLSQIMWKDNYHLTHSVHRILAKDVPAQLELEAPVSIFVKEGAGKGKAKGKGNGKSWREGKEKEKSGKRPHKGKFRLDVDVQQTGNEKRGLKGRPFRA
ncbi:cellulose-binding GDSL lipase/acylhydrolase, carbohydrate Esterase Family 16 protein [Pseudohyphozyma bogoriensis]|nr:cellulose-binding GDSL lipase/acylhydrolase, carbohydrate Esterase Family 16 protein [Pseudohyphozyma bogoriensis]